MPFLDDLITQLHADGVGTLGTNIFATSKAGIPLLASGATLQILETQGMDAEHTQNSTVRPAYVNPQAQLTARAYDPDVAYAMAQAAYNSLNKIRNTFINSGWYKWIKPKQEPFDGGVDERKQIRIKFNVRANKRP